MIFNRNNFTSSIDFIIFSFFTINNEMRVNIFGKKSSYLELIYIYRYIDGSREVIQRHTLSRLIE